MTSSPRRLIVNADDFGQSAGVNRGIIETHEKGILTSASLMVRWPAAAEAASYARAHRSLGVGLHLDFGEWTLQRGEWVERYHVVDRSDPSAVAEEMGHQLGLFRDLMSTEPTHIDSHQHAHRDELLRDVVMEVARELGIPVRHFASSIAYRGNFYGQTEGGESNLAAISPEALITLIGELSDGATEIACHPGYGHDLDTMYREEREHEVRSLCDPRVRAAIAEARIELCSFASFRGPLSFA